MLGFFSDTNSLTWLGFFVQHHKIVSSCLKRNSGSDGSTNIMSTVTDQQTLALATSAISLEIFFLVLMKQQ